MIASQFWKDALFLSVQLLFSIILFIALIAIIVFSLRGSLRKHKPADLAVFEKLSFFTGPARNRFFLFITFLGKHQFLIPANLLLLGYFIFIRKNTEFSIRIAAVALSSLVLMLLMKNLFRRKRPLEPLLKSARGLSFPSGHAIMAVCFYGLLVYFLRVEIESSFWRSLIIILLVILIFLIGFSRVYLRVHYSSDVLAGFIIGILWLWISLAVVKTFRSKTKELVASFIPVPNPPKPPKLSKPSKPSKLSKLSQPSLTYTLPHKPAHFLPIPPGPHG